MLPTVLRWWSWLYSYFVWLCGFYYGFFFFFFQRFMLSFLPCSLFSFFFFFSVINLLGVYVLLVHLFVNFARVNFCHFSLPLCVRGWLWVVIVSLPGPFYFFPHKPFHWVPFIHELTSILWYLSLDQIQLKKKLQMLMVKCGKNASNCTFSHLAWLRRIWCSSEHRGMSSFTIWHYPSHFLLLFV